LRTYLLFGEHGGLNGTPGAFGAVLTSVPGVAPLSTLNIAYAPAKIG